MELLEADAVERHADTGRQVTARLREQERWDPPLDLCEGSADDEHSVALTPVQPG